MTTLVTGAFGCIGAWVCKRLLEAGERTVAFDVGDEPWRMRMIVAPERLRDVRQWSPARRVTGSLARQKAPASRPEGARMMPVDPVLADDAGSRSRGQ